MAFVCIAFISFAAHSQTTQVANLTLNTRNNYHNGLKINQSVINLFTSGNENLLAEWNTIFELHYHWVANKNSLNTFEINLSIDKIVTKGHDYYRDFQIGYALVPDVMMGRFTLYTTQGSDAFKVNFKEIPASVSLGNFSGTTVAKVDGSIDSFLYSEEKFKQLQELVSQINQYWAVNEFVDQVNKDIASLESNNIEQPVQLFLLREKIRKSLLLVKETAAFQVMEKTAADPAALWAKYPDLERLLTRYSTLFSNEINKSISQSSLITEITSAYRKDLLKVFKKAYVSDFRSHELILRTGRLAPDNQFYSATDLLTDTEKNVSLAESIAFEFVSLADSIHESGDFVNALGLYEDAQKILEDKGHTNASDDVKKRVESTKLGLLRSYLQIAAKALEAGNDSLSRVYQMKSNFFVNKYPENNLVNRIAGESDALIKTYLRKGTIFVDQKQYLAAIQMFEQAANTARSYYNNTYNEQINQSLFMSYRYIFLELVQEAENYYLIGDLPEAKHRLEYALNYQKDHFQYLRTSNEALYLKNKIKGNDDSNLNSLASNSQSNFPGQSNIALPENLQQTENDIIQMINNAQLKVWANEMDDAWKVYEKASELAQSSHLDKKKTVKEAFQQLDQRMIERICLNHRFKIDDLMTKSKVMIAQKDYEDLKPTLQEIIDLSANNQGCILNSVEANTLMETYYDLFRYQDDYKAVLNNLYSSGLQSVIPLYTIFDQQLEGYKLANFGVKHQTLSQFVKSQNNGNLTLQAISFYLEQMDAENMLVYLKILLRQDFPAYETLEMQEKMATLIAVADHQNGIRDASKRVYELIQDDKRFSEFKKNYLRSMKKLSKMKE